MKKVFFVLMSVLMVVTLSVTAFAASGAFVESPSATPAPALVEYESDSATSTATLAINAFGDRTTMSPEAQAKFDEAYDQIVNSSEDNAFTEVLSSLAKSKKVKAGNLAVSDLFDISCSESGDQGTFTVKIQVETTENFVGIVHFTGEEWEMVEIVSVDSATGAIAFKASNFSPFAIVVNNGGASGSHTPAFVLPLVISLAAAAALAVVIVLIVVAKKKKKAAGADN